MSKDVGLQARVDAFLRRLKVLPYPWPRTYYDPLGDGIGELRVDYKNVEQRFYGFFGPGPNQFTVIVAASGKKRQNAIIVVAKKIKKDLDRMKVVKKVFKVENYDV